MSATYAAAGKVPIASLLLLCEATANFSLALPMAVANGLAYALSGRSTVYDVQRERSEGDHRRGYLVASPWRSWPSCCSASTSPPSDHCGPPRLPPSRARSDGVGGRQSDPAAEHGPQTLVIAAGQTWERDGERQRR